MTDRRKVASKPGAFSPQPREFLARALVAACVELAKKIIAH